MNPLTHEMISQSDFTNLFIWNSLNEHDINLKLDVFGEPIVHRPYFLENFKRCSSVVKVDRSI